MPTSERMNRYSATDSSLFSLSGFDVLIEPKEKIQEQVSNTAIIDVNSSSRCISVRSAIRNDVITIRQNPNRFPAVPRICCDVLLAMPEFTKSVW